MQVSIHSSLQGQQDIPYIDILKKALNIKAWLIYMAGRSIWTDLSGV